MISWLYTGDAGQNMWEAVDVVQAGGNYGWKVRQGAHCFKASNHNQELPNCPTADPQGNPLIDPVLEFMNLNQSGGLGLTVIGGNVYRGSAIPALSGKYVFASWSSSWSSTAGQLLIATPGPLNSGLWMAYALPTTDNPMGLLNTSVLSFGQGSDGELYVLTSTSIGPQGNGSAIWKIVPGQ